MLKKLSRLLTAGAFSAVISSTGFVATVAAETLKFIEGAPPSISMTEVYVAEAAKFFAQEGLDVSVDFGPNGAVATQMIAADQGDIGDVTMEAYMAGFANGMRGKFVAARGGAGETRAFSAYAGRALERRPA